MRWKKTKNEAKLENFWYPLLCLRRKLRFQVSAMDFPCISDQRRNEDIYYIYNNSTKVYKKLHALKFDLETIESTCFTSLGPTIGGKLERFYSVSALKLHLYFITILFRRHTEDSGRECQSWRFSIYNMWNNIRVESWKMKELRLKYSWKKLFVIEPNLALDEGFVYVKPLLVMRNDEILIEKREGQLILYEPRSGIETYFKIRGDPRLFHVTGFVGSLVSPFHNQG
ncbi:hypothetical protein EZV62_004654 [Acer yangbiense]|uniref:F-box associated domain-containing protein n=1 Tax=Acer yangbiense TaxID=1000413 RepID=A0A5C7IKV9_9ROSI|nr:hypothetical protein EZV62_004654 [Acer yangbiense]